MTSFVKNQPVTMFSVLVLLLMAIVMAKCTAQSDNNNRCKLEQKYVSCRGGNGTIVNFGGPSRCHHRCVRNPNDFKPPYWRCGRCTYRCFQSKLELQKAIGSYVEGNATNVKLKYGPKISNWCVRRLTDMSYLLRDSISDPDKLSNFDEDLSKWNVGKVRNMSGMFALAWRFNSTLDKWNVSSVVDFSNMFESVIPFNHDISKWNTSSATNMAGMFACPVGPCAFNQPISTWDVSKVNNMANMFSFNLAFNQPLASWDVSKVTDMSSMFDGGWFFGAAFDQNLCPWGKKLNPKTIVQSMFFSTSCPNTTDPSFNTTPPGPFCYSCS